MYAGTTHACQNTRWLDYEIEKLSTHSTLSRATCWALLYAYLQIFHLCSTVCTTWRLRRFFDILDFPLRCTSLRSQLSDTWMYLVWQTSDPSPNDSACFDTMLLLLHRTVFFYNNINRTGWNASWFTARKSSKVSRCDSRTFQKMQFQSMIPLKKSNKSYRGFDKVQIWKPNTDIESTDDSTCHDYNSCTADWWSWWGRSRLWKHSYLGWT